MAIDLNDTLLPRIYAKNDNILGMLNSLSMIMNNKSYKKLKKTYQEIASKLPKDEEMSEFEKEYINFGTDVKYTPLYLELDKFEHLLEEYNSFKKLSDKNNEIVSLIDSFYNKDFDINNFILLSEGLANSIIDIKNSKYLHQFTKLFDNCINNLFISLELLALSNNNKLLAYINNKDNDFLNEKLASIIRKTIKVDKFEGDLDANYLRMDTILVCANSSKDISIKKEKALEYEKKLKKEEEKRLKEIASLKEKISNLESSIMSNKNKLEEIRKRKKLLILKKNLLNLVAGLAIAVPLSSPFLGYAIGKHASSKVNLTKTITNTIDTSDESIVSTYSEYKEFNTFYVYSLTICEPWVKNSFSSTYTRLCTVYDYNLSTDESLPSNFSLNDINPDYLVEKYTYQELSEGEPKDYGYLDKKLYLTETYQNPDDITQSNKYNVPGLLIGLGLAGLVGTTELLAVLNNAVDLGEDKREINQSLKQLGDEDKDISLQLSLSLDKKLELQTKYSNYSNND